MADAAPSAERVTGFIRHDNTHRWIHPLGGKGKSGGSCVTHVDPPEERVAFHLHPDGGLQHAESNLFLAPFQGKPTEGILLTLQSDPRSAHYSFDDATGLWTHKESGLHVRTSKTKDSDFQLVLSAQPEHFSFVCPKTCCTPIAVWGHAVNDRDKLRKSLEDPKVNYIEADIGLNTVANVPVMLHGAKSDKGMDQEFPFSEWLGLVLAHNAARPEQLKHIKLDFKNVEVVRPCVLQVRAALDARPADSPKIDVWLNADVVPGPASCDPVTDPRVFVEACRDPDDHPNLLLPSAVLSFGWDTAWSIMCSGFSQKHVEDMMHVCNELVPPGQPLTFAVRASYAKKSWGQLVRLLDPRWRQGTSITFWTSDEGIPQKDLNWFKEHQRGGAQLYFDTEKGSKEEWTSFKRLF